MSNFRIISIEGNIGSGKSTFLENLKKHYKGNENIVFLREPVDEWEKIKDKNGNTMLQKFYADQDKYSFAFQMMAYISRLSILRETIKTNKDKDIIIITERSLYTDKYVFAKMLYDQGKIEDATYQIYTHWFDEFAKDFPVKNIIYFNAQPQKCYGRIHKRARLGEEIIPLAYLEDCHKYHEEFLDPKNEFNADKIVLDGNIDIFENEKIVEKWIEETRHILVI
jgi:deoxyadenosine/deoxycytidine kinase